MSNKKLFVVIEGVDGAGKSSVLNLVVKKINATSIETPSGLMRKYRHLVENAHPTIRFLYYVLANHIQSFSIRKLLRENSVICSRFAHSTKAHHAIYGCFIARHAPLWILANQKPDLIFYLMVQREEREKRIYNRKNNNAKDLDSAALEKVDKTFRALPGMIHIDTTYLSADEVSDKIIRHINARTMSSD